MQTYNATAYLTYADLQMAAEAVGLDRVLSGGLSLKDALEAGNNRSSKFTPTQAAQFIEDWSVVDHQPNTSTGFSGTLFKCRRTDPARGLVEGQLVMCMRSTEFADDNVRDAKATGELEIKAFGWAFGQIDDMERWYADLRSHGLIDRPVTVTGYSLGGHLATAFTLMRGDVPPVVATGGGAVHVTRPVWPRQRELARRADPMQLSVSTTP